MDYLCTEFGDFTFSRATSSYRICIAPITKKNIGATVKIKNKKYYKI